MIEPTEQQCRQHVTRCSTYLAVRAQKGFNRQAQVNAGNALYAVKVFAGVS